MASRRCRYIAIIGWCGFAVASGGAFLEMGGNVDTNLELWTAERQRAVATKLLSALNPSLTGEQVLQAASGVRLLAGAREDERGSLIDVSGLLFRLDGGIVSTIEFTPAEK